MGNARLTRLLERVAIVVSSLVIVVGVIALLSGGLLAGSDDPGVSGTGVPVGVHYRDLGDGVLAPGARHPTYDSDPPTSGAHVPVPVRHDQSELSDDQLLQAISVGDVVILYGTRLPPAGLKSLANAVAAPFTPALAAGGQAIILARRPGTRGLIGVAWTRLLFADSPVDPALHGFLSYWVGRRASRADALPNS